MFKKQPFVKIYVALGLLIYLFICLDCNTKACPPCASPTIQEKTCAPFYFVREFPMQLKATLLFGEELGGGRSVVEGNGTMIFNFLPTVDPNVLSLHLKHIEVALRPIELPLTIDPNSILSIEGFKLGSEDFDLQAFEGNLNTSTKRVSLKLTFTLDPEKIPLLYQLGIFAPFRIVATEEGIMDLETGHLETHAEAFNLGRGALKFVTVMGGQWDCEMEINKFCASTAKSPITSFSYTCPTDVWICPGESAILYWDISGEAMSAEITPHVGGVSLWTGNVAVSPITDTKYTLIVKNNCELRRSVTVRVLEPGRPRLLSATPNLENGVWSVNVLPQTTSANIRVTSVMTVSCGWWDVAYPYWNCVKTDLDGFVNYFDVYAYPTSPANTPLVGLWAFVPLTKNRYEITGNACFSVTMTCDDEIPPPKGRACFTGETPVWAGGTLVPISKVGLGWNVGFIEAVGAGVSAVRMQGFGKVEKIEEHEGTFECRDIVLENGNRISVVDAHCFMLDSGQWIASQNLHNGLKLKTLFGTVTIKSVTTKRTPFIGTVYNLRIKGSDQYMVGKNAVIVRDY